MPNTADASVIHVFNSEKRLIHLVRSALTVRLLVRGYVIGFRQNMSDLAETCEMIIYPGAARP